MRPGFHYYQLIVDGQPMSDPSRETYFGWAQPTSGLEVPYPALDFYDVKPVPHGEVRDRPLLPDVSRSQSPSIAGLSMAAGPALNIRLANLDRFAYIGAFSGGTRNFDPMTSFGGILSDPAGMAETSPCVCAAAISVMVERTALWPSFAR